MAKHASMTSQSARFRLSEVRRHLGLSQDALSRLIGVHVVTINRWERGKSPINPWHELLLAGLLNASPRPDLARLLYDPSINPVAVLTWLLCDAFRLEASVKLPAPPSLRARAPLAQSRPAAPAPPSAAALPAPRPPPEVMSNPLATRFELLEVDED